MNNDNTAEIAHPQLRGRDLHKALNLHGDVYVADAVHGHLCGEHLQSQAGDETVCCIDCHLPLKISRFVTYLGKKTRSGFRMS